MKKLSIIGFFAKITIAVLILIGASSLLFAEIFKITKLPLTDDQQTLYSGTLGIMVTSLVFAIYAKKKGVAKEKADHKMKLDLRAILIALVSIAAIKVLFGTFVGMGLGHLFPTEAYTSNKSTWLDHAYGIIIAPIAEEMMFRFGLYNIVSKRVGKTASLIFTSVIFTMLHGFRLDTLIEIFAASVVYTMIYELTGNVWYNIICHMMSNAFTSIVNELVHSGIPVFTEPKGYVIFNNMVMIAAAFIIITAILVFKKKGFPRV